MKLFQTKNRLVEFFLIVFLSAFFVILYFYPLIKNINSSLLNGVKNTEQFIFIWNFWHFDQAVKSGDSIFYTDKIIDLKKHNLYLHTSALWQTITTVFLGNKYIARFNFSFLLSHFLTIIFCFYFFRKLEFNFLFSAFGSLLFNFSSYRLGLYIHLNIANVEFFPLFFLLLFHFLDNPNILNSVWISVVMVIQYFSEYNYFVFMHFSILICFATYWFFDKNKTFVFMKYLCLIYFLCIAAVFPFLKNALIEAFDMKKSIHISFIRTLDYCLDLFAPIIPDCLTGLFSKKIYGHRFNAYLGVPIIFSMLYFLKNLLQKKIRDKNLIIVFILFALFFILSLG
nr:hypothetical protein [bacterium]